MRASEFLSVVILLLGLAPAQAAIPPHRGVVPIGAAVTTTPSPQIVLTWKTDTAAKTWTLYRRPAGANGHDNWGTAISVPVVAGTNDMRYTDTQVSAGAAYEYRIDKVAVGNNRDFTASGFILVGVDEPPIEKRGKLILMVDDRLKDSLAPELTRLMQDLAGDGWEIIRRDVASSLTVPQVKAIIKADYAADPTNVKTVFLLGHFAVPYSGNIAPDGHHVDHMGAWPADVYYGDMDGPLWTDAIDATQVSKLSPRIVKHKNVPGDGKFDQSTIPGDGIVELEVGRVDLADMSVFGVTETELLRRYLDKDHAYRHRAFDPERRALNIDGFGDGLDGFQNFSPLLGFDKIAQKGAMTWFPALRDGSYLWAYAAGGGQPTSCTAIGTTTDFANNSVQSVFHILYGSFFGVWDDADSLLRAPLASQPMGLTCLWGRRFWTLHEMGLGRHIGFSVRRSQSKAVAQLDFWGSGIQTALMGDPTLRLFMVGPPRNVAVAPDGKAGVVISWGASPDAVAGYHVYRSAGVRGPFTRLTGNANGASGFVTGNTYTDAAPPAGPSIYMVRAVKLEKVNSGTYYNLSQGIPVRYPVQPSQLTVTTAGGAPQTSPPVRLLPSGSYQTLTVPDETKPAGLSVCAWTGTGRVPSSGTGTSVRVFLDRDSTIKWQWSPNHDSAVTVTAPAQGQNFSQPANRILFKATAKDVDGLISKVEFYEGTTLLGEERYSVFDFIADPSGTAYKANGQPAIATYSYAWKNVPDGSYSVTAKAYDSLGGITTSAPVKFTVGGRNAPPTVSVGIAVKGTTYKPGTTRFSLQAKGGTARFNLQAAAADDGAVTKVEYLQGTISIGSVTVPPYYLGQNLGVGTYTYTAKATDNQGAASTSTAITIEVIAGP